ncbi:hypothetical protein SAMN06893096_10229 [Geodermatophilus pulveris]|uniref:Uncharacterized protein n=1 Tax=Geodermatophilus pulveris TaxID=1564159 RepID=A0A239BRI5_9ACTN|nr:hypothetical protein [Geodermatophilus pulveris]SNS10486.1 hypothetical protein SAMN06893096_10229 [Geodermatophilus pulveris]
MARKGEASVAQVARDFGVLGFWLAAGRRGPTEEAAAPVDQRRLRR